METNKEINVRLLDLYIQGKIGADQVFFLDGSRPTEVELKKAVEDYEDLITHIKGAGLKKELAKIHEQSYPSNRAIKWPRIIAIAASIILIAVFSILLLHPENEPEFEDYFTHFDQLITFRGNTEPDYDGAIEKYSLRNYPKALELFQKIQEDSMTMELKFYAGVSALGAKKNQQAIDYFEAIGTDTNNKYFEQTRWYLALSYWQNKEDAKAIALLTDISKGDFKYAESQQLLTLFQKKD